MTDTSIPATSLKCRIIVEETIYGRKEPWLTLARKSPRVFGWIMKNKALERWTRGELKGHFVTESDLGEV